MPSGGERRFLWRDELTQAGVLGGAVWDGENGVFRKLWQTKTASFKKVLLFGLFLRYKKPNKNQRLLFGGFWGGFLELSSQTLFFLDMRTFLWEFRFVFDTAIVSFQTPGTMCCLGQKWAQKSLSAQKCSEEIIFLTKTGVFLKFFSFFSKPQKGTPEAVSFGFPFTGVSVKNSEGFEDANVEEVKEAAERMRLQLFLGRRWRQKKGRRLGSFEVFLIFSYIGFMVVFYGFYRFLKAL